MFVHTVLLRVRSGTTQAQLDDLAERVQELADAVAGPGTCVIGANATEEPLDQGYGFGFILRFPDRGVLDAYQVNPSHQAVSLLIRDLAETVLVFDVAEPT